MRRGDAGAAGAEDRKPPGNEQIRRLRCRAAAACALLQWECAALSHALRWSRERHKAFVSQTTAEADELSDAAERVPELLAGVDAVLARARRAHDLAPRRASGEGKDAVADAADRGGHGSSGAAGSRPSVAEAASRAAAQVRDRIGSQDAWRSALVARRPPWASPKPELGQEADRALAAEWAAAEAAGRRVAAALTRGGGEDGVPPPDEVAALAALAEGAGPALAKVDAEAAAACAPQGPGHPPTAWHRVQEAGRATMDAASPEGAAAGMEAACTDADVAALRQAIACVSEAEQGGGDDLRPRLLALREAARLGAADRGSGRVIFVSKP